MKKFPLSSLNSAATLIMFAAILLVCSSVCYADVAEVPDITMTVLESEDAAERVVSEIQLPERASPMAQERAANGLSTANEARERGQEIANQARDRGKKKPEQPGRPDKPGKPDQPGRPDNPGNPDKP